MSRHSLKPPVPSHRFSRYRLQVGYDISEVDEFLRRALHALETRDGSMNASDVESARFGLAARFKQGYDMGQVDDELDRVALAFQELERPSSAPN